MNSPAPNPISTCVSDSSTSGLRSRTWHPQGPVHPQPSPVPLHFIRPLAPPIWPAAPSSGGGGGALVGSVPDTFGIGVQGQGTVHREAWHPQGPHHPTPPPPATTFHTAPRPSRLARRAVV